VMFIGGLQTIYKLVASDADSGVNAELLYNLKAINASDTQRLPFTFTPSGHLTLLIPLDRETRDVYDMKAVVTDVGSLSCETRIRVQVEDVNDCAPTFEHSEYNITISENVNTTGHFLIQLTAFDKDLGVLSIHEYNTFIMNTGKGGAIRYTMQSSDADTFAIEEVTGAISVLHPLDRETKEKYTLVVTARDMGQPSLQSSGM
jgi:hypothetical protein